MILYKRGVFMDSNIQNQLEQTLQSDSRVWVNNDSKETSILAKNILLDLVEKTDPTIIGLLLGNDDLKRHFFVEMNGVLVFKLQDFRFFLDKHSINNSYTKYANRIGLTDGNRFLKDNSDIVLDFPFKDCVLNGGQSTEEGEEIYFKRNNDQSDSQLYTKLIQKRQEIFFNQTLAFDEIDRLFDAKAFSKFSRYTADGEQPVDEIKRHSDGTPAENLIIKGNNLIALHSLAKQFKGRVKLIYIDPPYNTGEDSFKYNDKFTHSSWLTFMKNRLEIAKTLLANDGVILVQIDNSPSSLRESPEYGYLLVLMDEIFTRKNYVTTFAWKKKGNASNTKDGVGTITESILMYAKDFESITPNLQEFKRKYKYIDENEKEYNLENPVKTNEGTYKRETMVFPIITDEGTFYPPEGKRWTIGNNILDENGKIKPDVKYEIKDGIFYLKKYSQDYKLGEAKLYANLLLEHGSLKVAKDEIEKLGFNREDFDSPKPEKLIQALLEINTNENDIILDYHLGSGTTAAVAHKMNRQYIGIEQMDYIETLAVERLKKVIDGEQGGISKAVNWQGGGEFVYAELAPFNETAKQQILACENLDDIKTLFDELCERYFLKYNVGINEFTQIIEESEFQSLPLDKQKQMVLEMLDLNQMYVSLSEMDDEQFASCLNDDDKALSRAFYQAEKKDGE